jgi:hypothetical protein
MASSPARRSSSKAFGQNDRSIRAVVAGMPPEQQEYTAAQLKAFRDHSRADPQAHT